MHGPGPDSTGPPEPVTLPDAVLSALAGAGRPSLAAGVQRLMLAYRSGEVPDVPVMTTRNDVAAYAAYRMPATVAATAAAVRQIRLSAPDWRPSTLLDIGAGTGSVAWAVVHEWPSVNAVTLLEQSVEAIRLGKSILAESGEPPLRAARWHRWRLPDADKPSGNMSADDALPTADLATAAYVLGELTESQQAALPDLAMAAAPAVLLIEPGTPAGHRRILNARAALIQAGYEVLAPCPHLLGCPLAVEGDWCHFAARLQRSALHRQVKGADLAYEDEKFSYVAAIRPEVHSAETPLGRIVRRPQHRKGLVSLDICGLDGKSRRELVARSKRESYKLARKANWGDRWPP